MKYAALLLAILANPAARAEIIDRIAVTVDDRVITQSGILREIRVTAFLNHAKPDFSPESRRQTAARLVEQAIIRIEMDITRYPAAEPDELREMIWQVKEDLFDGSDSAYRAALNEYRITELELERHLERQASTMRFLELRFRPEVQLSETEIRDYYDKEFLPLWRKANPGASPSFDELRPDAEERLAAERVDKLVDKWIKESLVRLQVRYREDAFK